MLKQILKEQYRSKFDQLTDIKTVIRPKEGWIRTLRKALNMRSQQLAARLGVSKSQVSQMERMEVEDRITLKQLRRVADSFDCDLVYALVPRDSVEVMIKSRASFKAKKIVSKVDTQMKLEDQQLSSEMLKKQLEIETARLLREIPSDLWDN